MKDLTTSPIAALSPSEYNKACPQELRHRIEEFVMDILAEMNLDNGIAQEHKTSCSTTEKLERMTLTVQEAAKMLGVCSKSIYDLMKSDSSFPAVRIGPKKIVINKAKLQIWLDEQSMLDVI